MASLSGPQLNKMQQRLKLGPRHVLSFDIAHHGTVLVMFFLIQRVPSRSAFWEVTIVRRHLEEHSRAVLRRESQQSTRDRESQSKAEIAQVLKIYLQALSTERSLERCGVSVDGTYRLSQ